MAVSLFIHLEKWPIAGKFAISRGAKTTAEVVVAELADGRHRGRGECVPYARYGETVEAVAAAIQAMREPLAGGLGRMGLQERMPAGAARNALDCAFWDLEAKRTPPRFRRWPACPLRGPWSPPIPSRSIRPREWRQPRRRPPRTGC